MKSMKKILFFLCPVCVALLLFVAGCTRQGYKVTFVYGFDGKITELEGQRGLIPEPEAPEQPGYSFGGWSPSGAPASERWSFEEDEVAADVALVAVWEPLSITIYLDPDGGDGCPESVRAVFGQENVIPEPRKTGYWFLGWMIADYPDSVFSMSFVEYDQDYCLKAAWLPFDPEQTIRFGELEQDGSADNGPEPIDWLILDMTDEKYVLLSRDVLHAMTYDALNADSPGTYVDSAIRDWLNHGFYDSAFSDAEKSMILPIRIDDPGITDKVTLLSTSERRKYLMPWRSRQYVAAASKAAVDAGLRLDNTKSGQKYCWWWLRQEKSDDGGYPSSFVSVSVSNVGRSMYGIRPMITVDRKAFSGQAPNSQ